MRPKKKGRGAFKIDFRNSPCPRNIYIQPNLSNYLTVLVETPMGGVVYITDFSRVPHPPTAKEGIWLYRGVYIYQ